MCSKSSSKQVEKTVNKSVNNDVKKINFSIIKNHYYSDAQGAGGGSLENNKKNDLKPTKRKDVKEVIFQTVTNNKITYIPKDFKQEKSQQSVKDQKINSFLNDIKKYEENLETKATKTVSNIKQVVKNINPEKTLDRTQVVLDLIGLVPGYGEPADLTNAGIYLIRNDKTNAMLSAGAAAPFIGSLGTSTKLGLKAVDAIKDANIVKKIINAGDETVSAGKLVDKGLKNNVIKGGTATTTKIDYKKVFFDQNPDLKGQVVVHHGVEQQVLTRAETKGLFTPEEIHAYDNLRGIPNEVNSDVHLSKIRKEWNRFYKENVNPTKKQLLEKRLEIDQKYGNQFNPPIK